MSPTQLNRTYRRLVFRAEAVAVDLTRWAFQTLLPTLAATFVGFALYLGSLLALGLAMGGCAMAPPAAPAPPGHPAEPVLNDDCLSLVHAVCNHYALCNDTVTEAPPAAYMGCRQWFASRAAPEPLCIEDGTLFVGPVAQCAEALNTCEQEAVVQLVCGAVTIIPPE